MTEEGRGSSSDGVKQAGARELELGELDGESWETDERGKRRKLELHREWAPSSLALALQLLSQKSWRQDDAPRGQVRAFDFFESGAYSARLG